MSPFLRDLAKLLLENGSDVNAKCCGTTCLHLALYSMSLPVGQGFGLECFNILLKNAANPLNKDENGNTLLHLIGEFNLPSSLIDDISQYGEISEIVNSNSKVNGITALHRAALSDSVDVVNKLIEVGANVEATTVYGQTSLHFAAKAGSAKVWKLLIQKGTNVRHADHFSETPEMIAIKYGHKIDTKNNLIPAKKHINTSHTTGIVTNPLCINHHTCPPSAIGTNNAPPENIKRITILTNESNGILHSHDIHSNFHWISHSNSAPMSDVLRVHEWSYVRQVQAKCEQIDQENPEAEDGIGYLDGDTTISKNTFNAALAAAGAVCQGVDLVMNKTTKNVFCPIRPPGHHAGPRGVVKLNDQGAGPDSHGFCLLNNISIGAAYAMNRYRDTIKKVAIVDFDVHHGNGTEETVRWLKPTLDTIPAINDIFFGQFHAPKYKPWYDQNDAENVLFVSVHGYGPRERGMDHLMPMAAFYPGSGKTIVPKLPTNGGSNEVEMSTTAKTNIVNNNGNNNGKSLDVMDIEKIKKDALNVADNNDDDDEDDDNSENDESFNDQNNEDDDEDEDEDDDYNEGGDDNDSDSNQTPPIRPNPYTNSKVHYLQRIYTQFNHENNNTKSKEHSLPPLILDVGVSLPEDDLNDPSLNIGGGKLIKEYSYRVQWRNYFRQIIFPKLMEFSPDLIFISAGFDAHKKDTINSGYIALIEEDYEWVTEQLVHIANTTCEGRIVSALEGGYQLGGEYYSAFAKSVKSHVSVLAKGYAYEDIHYSQDVANRESEIEAQVIKKLEDARERELERREQARLEQLARLEEQIRLKQLAEQQELQGGDPYVESTPTFDNVNTNSNAHNIATNGDVNNNSSNNNNNLSNGDGQQKKRRRPQVDYVALDKELREAKESKVNN